MDLTWKPQADPALRTSENNPQIPVLTKIGETELDRPPIFLLTYQWPTRYLLWLWPGVFILAGLAWIRRQQWWTVAFLMALGLVATITSLLFWQQTYGVLSAHQDPDRYGLVGNMFHQYVFGKENRTYLEMYIRGYPHAFVATVPFVLSILITVGLPLTIAYPFLVSVSSFAVILVLWRTAQKIFGLENQLLIACSLLAATYLPILMAFARPSTDMPGLFCVSAMLAILLWRLKESTSRQIWMAALLGIALVMVRPPGPFFLLFFGIGFVVADIIRDREMNLLNVLRTGLLVAGPGTVIFFSLYFLFDWQHNMNLSMKKSKEFVPYHAPDYLLQRIPKLVGVLPLAWIFARWRNSLERRAVMLLLIWAVFYFGILIAFKAPFLTRLFLPTVPVLLLLTSLGIREIGNQHPKLVYGTIIVIAAVNIGIVGHLISLPDVPPPSYSWLVYD